MFARPVDRRLQARASLYETRRRYARVEVACTVYYESAERSLFAERADVSLRGLFLPTRFPDREGTKATVRLDTGTGPMIRLDAMVLRSHAGQKGGMALRVIGASEADRLRLAALLIRVGGLQSIPQLDRRYATLARSPRPRQVRKAA